MKKYTKKTIKPFRIRIRKHFFQLLELMVAMFILLVCAAPLMRMFTTLYQSQLEVIRQNQKDHFVHLFHAKVVEQLYKKKISLEDLKQDGKIITLGGDESFKPIGGYSFKIEGVLEIKKPKDFDKSHDEYLAILDIAVTDLVYKSSDKTESEDEEGHPVTHYEYYIYIKTNEKNSNSKSSANNDPSNESTPQNQNSKPTVKQNFSSKAVKQSKKGK